MSLTEIMSSAKLSIYPIVGLIFFMIAFSAVLWRVFAKCNKKALDEASRIPLDDARVCTPRPTETK